MDNEEPRQSGVVFERVRLELRGDRAGGETGRGEERKGAVTAIKEIVADITNQFSGRAVPPAEHRLRSRAILIQANVAILEGDNMAISRVVDQLLRPLLSEDPDYYYAIMTLAQT